MESITYFFKYIFTKASHAWPVVCFFLACQLQGHLTFAQENKPRAAHQRIDPVPLLTVDSLRSKMAVRDSILLDTVKLGNALRDTIMADSNKDELSDPIKSQSADSQWMDVRSNITHLYKDAKVMYGEFELSADYIRMNNNTGVIFASGLNDHNGKYKGRPIFKTATDPPITVDSLFYNIKSRKAKVFGVHTEEDGGYINARELKKNQYDEAFLKNGLYSTCDLPYPHTHFGIHITKGIVTENRIIAGPSYLVVENVPIPFIGIPFGFFPKTNKRASGLIFPSFGEDGTRGFFLRDVGWYFGINDYWDAKVTGTLYTKGSYEGALAVQYQKRYNYNGNFNFRYASVRNGVEGTPGYKPNKDFNLTWSHSQSQEANPGTTFSASVNLGTSSYFQNTGAAGTYDYTQLTRNQMSSNISYGKTFGDGRFNMTATLGHRQDIPARIPNSTLPQAKGSISLELPTFRLSMQSFNPFDSKDRVGDQKWYQRITVGYTLDVKNSIQTTEDSLFKKDALKKFQNGVQHTIPVSLSLNVLKYFQFNSSLNYTERWYLQTTRLALDNAPSGYVQTVDTVRGFNRNYNYSISSGLSTKVYGMYGKIGKMQAMRHMITPSVNFNYTPDFSNPRYGFYRDFITPGGDTTNYSIYRNNVFGGPPSGRNMGIGFSVDNTLEAKFLSKTDTANGGFKKVPILQGLSFSGNYNFVADSMKLSTIGFSGRTALFNQKMGINFGGSLDPYALDSTGRRINRYLIKEGKLARLTNFNLSFSYSFNADAAKSHNDNLNELDEKKTKMTDEQRRALDRISTDPNAFVDFKIPWNVAASFSFNYSKPGYVSQVTSTLNVSGDFNVTDNWKVTYNSGYDFRAKKTTLTQFNIYRDLHCWDMSFGWIPFGGYRSFTFTIRAKASILQDLKLDKRSDYYNSF
ncbi:LPS assembly outer membrane protein LptD (organic solvent tolerance protein OstA) [bacterium A37T11]|nr:LPS assembly outer membrane protein LptD (organic solvent tolerance protein OstA) [bacterium A37T11]